MRIFVISTIALELVVILSCARVEVPQAVANAFKAKFPKAQQVKWDKESENEFEAAFVLNGKEMTASFDAGGKWLETEVRMAREELPQPVFSTLDFQFANSKIKKIESLEKAGEPVVYKIKLEKEGRPLEVVLNTDGTVIKKEVKSENEEKEGEEEEKKGREKSEEKEEESREWVKSFDLAGYHFSSIGENQFFILRPGYQLILEGKEGKHPVKLIVSVLDETEKIGDIETRVVEEREIAGEKLAEISRNFFAIDSATGDIFYFGEDVDIYKNGKLVGHEGGWRADQSGNHAGMMMPGTIRIGARFYQEVAPGVAMDRAEIVNQNTVMKTPAGTFNNCLKIEETTPLEPGVKEYKIYAPNIGLVRDGDLLLSKYGYHIFQP